MRRTRVELLQRVSLLAAVCVFSSSVPVMARGWEISVLGGWTAPTFKQDFVFDVDIDVPGARQVGQFTLTAEGSFAFGGAVAYFFNDHFGIEGRVDTVKHRHRDHGAAHRVSPRSRLRPSFGNGVVQGRERRGQRRAPLSLFAERQSAHGREHTLRRLGGAQLPPAGSIRRGAAGERQPRDPRVSTELARTVVTAGALADASREPLGSQRGRRGRDRRLADRGRSSGTSASTGSRRRPSSGSAPRIPCPSWTRS